jgi:predicted Zn-dependent protease
VSDRELPYEFVVINDSTPNAWALPGGKIAVHRGLLTELGSEAELAAVLGHEIVHAAARHGARAMERQMLMQGAALATMIMVQDSRYGNLAMTGAGLLSALVTQKYGRDAERESDLYGTTYLSRAGYDPYAAVALQEAFVKLSAGRETNWLEGLFASHPPSQERVENNRALAATLPPGGEYGKEAYASAMATLTNASPAYEAYDKGRKALAEGHQDQALSHAQAALSSFPAEPSFHVLRGDIRSSQERWRDAVVNYDRAISRYDRHFYSLMRRGLARKALSDSDGATADLEKSMELLPSVEASNALGELRLAAGDRTAAMEYFRAASGADSPSGQAARRSLTRLELSEKPHLYLKAELGLTQNGMVGVRVSNPTDFSVGGIRVVIQYLDDAQQVQSMEAVTRNRLTPGSNTIVATRFGPYADATVLRRMRTAVSRARIVQ